MRLLNSWCGKLFLVFACALSLLDGRQALGAAYSFVKISDTSAGPFFSFAAPVIDQGNIAFAVSTGFGSPNAIYTNATGPLTMVVDGTVQRPGSVENFSSIGSRLSFQGGELGFQGADSTGRGIYSWSGGPIVKIADDTDLVPPGGSSTFMNFDRPSISGGSAVFYGEEGFFSKGLYTTYNGSVQALADFNTPMPGSVNNFSNLSSRPVNNGSVAVFVGSDMDGLSGVFVGDHASLTKIANTNDAAPGGTGNFAGFSTVSLDQNGKVAFVAFDQASASIFSNVSGSLQMVYGASTQVPQQSFNFENFENMVLDNGKFAFVGKAQFGGFEGIYTTINGSLEKLVARNDVIDGKVVQSVSMSEDAIDGDQIAFRVSFDDGTSGIFLASTSAPTVVEPDTVAAELTTGSPITISQSVDTPGLDFNLEFDYKFTTPSGHLAVTLGGVQVGTLLAPELLQTNFARASFPVSGALLGQTGIELALTLDGLTGSQILLDNFAFPGLVNGDFETGSLSGWTASGPGSAGTVTLAASLGIVPEPSSLALLSLFCAGAALCRPVRRR